MIGRCNLSQRCLVSPCLSQRAQPSLSGITHEQNYHRRCGSAGPIQRADSRPTVIKRLLELLRQAAEHKCNLVVFPELALTTFFPRWWMTNQDEIDSFSSARCPEMRRRRCSMRRSG